MLVLVSQLIPIQIDDWEAEIIVSPNQIAIFDAKGGEHSWIKIDSNIGMARVGQKWLEVDGLFDAIIECEAKAVITRRLSGNDINGRLAHWSLRVIRSDLMDLCRTKKSIHF